MSDQPELRVYNSAAGTKTVFEPIDAQNVRMYVCGPTVYDRAHVGNARPVVVFDVLYRVLSRLYPRVTYCRNITDVDDKINQRALDSGVAISDITAQTIAAYHEDMAALNALPPTVEPRATDHIDQMIEMIQTLIAKGFAYEAEGHVLFHVSSWEDYGAFANRSPEELLAGARVEVAPYKKDAGDFVLWKPSDESLPGWDSPWGRGRPGWHIECSAMSRAHLGATFDIHGGGADLKFPHHQNEIAQSVCCTGEGYAKYWMHNGFLMVDGEKMSKSLGNFKTVEALLQDWSGEVIRLSLLSTHYRQPLDLSAESLQQSKNTLDKFYRVLEANDFGPASVSEGATAPDVASTVMTALLDDLNTPGAISALHGLMDQPQVLRDSAAVLGLLQADPAEWFRGGQKDAALSAEDIDAMIVARKQARADKNFAEADRIRDALAEAGVVIEDGAGGTSWRWA